VITHTRQHMSVGIDGDVIRFGGIPKAKQLFKVPIQWKLYPFFSFFSNQPVIQWEVILHWALSSNCGTKRMKVSIHASRCPHSNVNSSIKCSKLKHMWWILHLLSLCCPRLSLSFHLSCHFASCTPKLNYMNKDADVVSSLGKDTIIVIKELLIISI